MADDTLPEEEPEISLEDKLQIAKKMLLQSPPGELLQVANDVRTLLGDDSSLNSVAVEAFGEYNVSHMIAVNLPESDQQALVTEAGKIDDTTFLDPRNGQVMTIDHIKQVCTATRPAEESENTPATAQPYRKSLEQALGSYVKDSFPSAEYEVYGSMTDGKIALTLCISSAKFSPKNFWNGRWRSVWKAELSADESSWEAKGSIKVVVHYFEEGNVQLDTDHEVTVSVSAKDPSTDGEALTAEIQKVEEKYLADLEEMYTNLSETTFKDLRRNLPVTRTKFPWAQAQHSLASELTRNSK